MTDMFDGGDDGKLASNFYASPSLGEFTHTGMTHVNMPQPPPNIDDNGIMDYSPIPLGMDTVTSGASDPSVPVIMMAPPPRPKNYKALAKAKIVEVLSAQGSPRRVRMNLSMIDEDTGTGKAVVTIGRDIKQRKFEIPITIKGGEVGLGKARDIVSNERMDLGTELLFSAPGEELMFKELDKTYEKYTSFFKGRVTDKKVDALMKRYPSLTNVEARSYLEQRYESNKGVIGRIWEHAYEHRKKLMILGGATTFFVALYIRNKLSKRSV